MYAIRSYYASEVERLTMGVKAGFVRGQTTKEIMRQVVGAGGLADISRRNAETIVSVITSYSIHYTKLYEVPSPRRAALTPSLMTRFSTGG